MVKDYIKKKIAVQAMVWTGDNPEDLKQFMEDQGYYFNDEDCGLYIETLEGDHKANTGDYIIKGVKGEFYPCKPDIFEMSYEEVEKCGSVKEADPKKELSGEDEEMAMAYIIKYAKFMENIDNEEVAQKIIDDLMK